MNKTIFSTPEQRQNWMFGAMLFLLAMGSIVLIFPVHKDLILEQKNWVRRVIIQRLCDPVTSRYFDKDNHVLISKRWVSDMRYDPVKKIMVDDSYWLYTIRKYANFQEYETQGVNTIPFYAQHRQLTEEERIRTEEELAAIFHDGSKITISLSEYLRLKPKRLYDVTAARFFLYKINEEKPLPMPESLLFDY